MSASDGYCRAFAALGTTRRSRGKVKRLYDVVVEEVLLSFFFLPAEDDEE